MSEPFIATTIMLTLYRSTFAYLNGPEFEDRGAVERALAMNVEYRAEINRKVDNSSNNKDEELVTEQNLFPRPPLIPNTRIAPPPLPRNETGEAQSDRANMKIGYPVTRDDSFTIKFPKPETRPYLNPKLADIVDSMRIKGQEVYVLDSRYKSFGRLIAANGKAHAIVLVDGILQPVAFPLKDVISM